MSQAKAYTRIQRKVVQLIKDSNFDLQLPQLSNESWRKIYHDPHERDRLEFLGDALMNSFVTQHVYHLLKDGSPYYYTEARSALTANATFAHIMARLGYFDMRGPIKPAGDAFEAVIGAYHTERGAEALLRWQEQYFSPLISCAVKVCRSLRSQDTRKRATKAKNSRTTPILARLRRERTPSIISPMRDRKARFTDRGQPSPSTRLKRLKPRLPPPVIDLTVESEPEDITGDILEMTSEVVEISAQAFEASKAKGSGPGILNTVASKVAPAIPSTPAVDRNPLRSTPGAANNPIAID